MTDAATAATGAAIAHDRSHYGGFWRRFGGILLDSLLIAAAFFVLGILLALASPGWAEAHEVEFNILGILASWLYFALTQSSARQASLGQRIMGLIVTDLAGSRIGFGRATGRHFAEILSGLTLGFGYLMNLFTARRQTLHDLVAGTLVLRDDAPAASVAAAPAQPLPAGLRFALIALACLLPVLVVGSLTAVAIPAYADYAARAHVGEAILHSAPYRTAIAERAAAGTALAEISLESLAGIETNPSPRAWELDVDNGVVRVTFGEEAGQPVAGTTLSWTPALSRTGEIAWVCGRAPPPPGFAAIEPDHAAGTDVPTRYLPIQCR